MTTAALSTPKDYALHYHDGGFSIFVLRNPEMAELAKDRKRPAVNWELYQIIRASKMQIERWFTKNPNYNIAIVMGNISGNAIGFDVDGPTARKRIEEKRVEMSTNLRVALDNTMMNRTGSDGMHIIFRVDEPIDDISQEHLWSDGQTHSQILMQGNGHYLVAAPSVHPNGNRYEWNGQTPQLITRQELNEFIRLVRPPPVRQAQQPPKHSRPMIFSLPEMAPTMRTLTPEQMEELLSWVKPYYNPGSRNDIIFYLSGMMRKTGGFSLDTARRFIKLLCNASGYLDEDLDKSLTVVDRTYRQPLDELNGKSGLHELLVTSYENSCEYDNEQYQIMAESFSQICQIINGEPSSSDPEEPPPENNGRGAGSGGGGDGHGGDGYRDRPGQWLERQMNADKDLDIITTVCNEVLRLNNFKTLSDTREVRWYNNNGIYLPNGENLIHAELEKLGGYHVSSHIRNEVIEHIKIRTLTDRSKFDRHTPCKR